MTTLGKESEEHERIVQAIVRWYRAFEFENIMAPAEEINGSKPDVQADGPKGRIYGEAKLCEDFPEKDTKEQLTRYTNLKRGTYLISLGVPEACRPEVEKVIVDWELDGSIEVKGF